MMLLSRLPLLRLLSRRLSISADVIRFSEEVQQARLDGAPLVALESTIITHGMPYPDNLDTATQVEQVIRKQGAVPATIAILQGQVSVGLSSQQLAKLSKSSAAVKTSRRDMAYVLANGLDGATTVAGTIVAADLTGIPIFATGGLGGVHRGGQHTMDVSADLSELGRSGVCVVCGGVKSILDIPRTLEYLETQGVLVASYGPTRAFSAFYTRRSGHSAPYNFQNAAAAARTLCAAHALRLRSGMVVAVPVPAESAMDEMEIDSAIDDALRAAEERGVGGKEITPFLLAAVAEATRGKSLATNVALIKNNAKVAAKIAVEFQKLQNSGLNQHNPHLSKSIKTTKPLIEGNSTRGLHTSVGREEVFGTKEPNEGKVKRGVLIIGGANLDRTYRVVEDELKSTLLHTSWVSCTSE